MQDVCTLCQSGKLSTWLLDEGNPFCCHGCLAVYTILRTKGELSQGMEHPLVKTARDFGIIHSEEKALPQEELETLKLYLDIEGLWCPSCAEVIRLSLLMEKGITKCTVDFATDLAFIEYHPLRVSKDHILKKISDLSYTPQLIEDQARKKASPRLKRELALSTFLSINLMMLSSPIYVSYFMEGTEEYGYLFAELSLLFALPVLFIAMPLFKRAYQQARFGFVGMEALVTIGVITAFILSSINVLNGSSHVYFDSMSVVIALVLLGKAIESEAKFSAKESLLRLMRATPKRARKRFPDGSSSFVPIKEIAIGDIVIAHTGEKIALDGVVIEGEFSADESLMTGEVRSVKKQEGSKVIGGTLVKAGNAAFRVLAKQGILQKIVDTIEMDLHKKREGSQVIDTISELFVPIVLMLSLGAFFWGGFDRMLALILISCPCAIGVAVPLVESSLLTALSNLGIIVRNRRVLSVVGKEDVYIFDKTGTVTEGKFEVLGGLELFSAEELALIKGATASSLHPIALAIHRAIEAASVKVAAKEIPGLGIESEGLFIGSREFLRLKGFMFPKALPKQGLVTEVYIALGNKTAVLQLGDTIKSGIKELVRGLKKTVLLSGDSEEVVSYIAKECGFDAWQACSSPLEKRAYIEELQKKGLCVAMIGDGINDAPAITIADVGISVVSASDISIQVSDILLTSEKMGAIQEMREIIRQGSRITKQNLFWAFFYNIVGVVMAFFGLLTPIYAAFAMAASSLICVFNSKRI